MFVWLFFFFNFAGANPPPFPNNFFFPHPAPATTHRRISASQVLDGGDDPLELVRGGSAEEPGRLQLARDLLDRLLDVGGLPRARADELAAPEQEDDDLRLVDPVDEAGELLRLILDFAGAERNRDRIQVDLRT